MSSPTQLPIDAAPVGYRPQSIDTNINADLVRFHLYRQRTAVERLILGAKYKQSARQLSIECLRQSFPELSEGAFSKKIAQAWLQEKCPIDYIPKLNPMSWSQDPTAIASLLAQILNTANIPYYITGGVAAIAHGEPRATIDLDVVISIDLADLPALAANFEANGFYVAGLVDVMAGSLQCLNITHLETIENVDLMISGREEYDLIKFDRCRSYTLLGSGEVSIASPEDVIISKLIWRRETQSDKQWRDILGILKVQQEKLDFVYLQGWVEKFEIDEDWQRVKIEAGLSHLG
ncbi:hypothetical protein [Chamaesiphon minutus]|uniref:Nucleotidyltransferase family protein n=1 Tax=Chamaesiphon minutus (strain ATCC 27169 / PCC 6605) TaxID=1173020 RepID=K9UCZ2_CHAP6|nr:hypothetical protein [Chamaesiphon minutus]AFY92271.1 hypothetical protein Cha6605_1036 [Chamaesiphon minutus PCC 6605]